MKKTKTTKKKNNNNNYRYVIACIVTDETWVHETSGVDAIPSTHSQVLQPSHQDDYSTGNRSPSHAQLTQC